MNDFFWPSATHHVEEVESVETAELLDSRIR